MLRMPTKESKGREADNGPTTKDPTEIAFASVRPNSTRLRRTIFDRTRRGQEEDQALPLLIYMFAVTSCSPRDGILAGHRFLLECIIPYDKWKRPTRGDDI